MTQYYHGDARPERHLFVGGAQDNGSRRVLSLDAPDAWRRIYGGDGGYVAIDPVDPQRLFIEFQGFPEFRRR